jgi:hypothetical protein
VGVVVDVGADGALGTDGALKRVDVALATERGNSKQWVMSCAVCRIRAYIGHAQSSAGKSSYQVSCCRRMHMTRVVRDAGEHRDQRQEHPEGRRR